MSEKSMSRTKSIYAKLAALTGLVVVLTVLLSAAFIAKEAGHDCAGHDCPVCASIAQCENTIRRIGSGLLPVIAVAVALVCALQIHLLIPSAAPALTPVSRKVRLNN